MNGLSSLHPTNLYDSIEPSLSGAEQVRNRMNKVRFGLTTSGLPACENWIRNELAARFISATDSGLLEGGRMIRQEAIPLTPKDTGHLRNTSYIISKKFGSHVITTNKRPSPHKEREEDWMLMQENFEDAKAKLQTIPMSGVTVGFPAGYANIVHDAGPYTNFKVGGPKYLQRAIEKNMGKIISVIIQKASVFFSVPKEWKKQPIRSKDRKKP